MQCAGKPMKIYKRCNELKNVADNKINNYIKFR